MKRAKGKARKKKEKVKIGEGSPKCGVEKRKMGRRIESCDVANVARAGVVAIRKTKRRTSEC